MPGVTGTGLINGEDAGCDKGLNICVGSEVKGACESGEDPVTCFNLPPGRFDPDCVLSKNLCGADIWEGADVGPPEDTVEGGVTSCECDDARFCSDGRSSLGAGGDNIDFKSITAYGVHLSLSPGSYFCSTHFHQ